MKTSTELAERESLLFSYRIKVRSNRDGTDLTFWSSEHERIFLQNNECAASNIEVFKKRVFYSVVKQYETHVFHLEHYHPNVLILVIFY